MAVAPPLLVENFRQSPLNPFLHPLSPDMASTIPPDDSQASTVLAVQWVTGSLAVILTLLRVYIRGFVRHNLGWDDYMIWIATVIHGIYQFEFEGADCIKGLGNFCFSL